MWISKKKYDDLVQSQADQRKYIHALEIKLIKIENDLNLVGILRKRLDDSDIRLIKLETESRITVYDFHQLPSLFYESPRKTVPVKDVLRDLMRYLSIDLAYVPGTEASVAIRPKSVTTEKPKKTKDPKK